MENLAKFLISIFDDELSKVKEQEEVDYFKLKADEQEQYTKKCTCNLDPGKIYLKDTKVEREKVDYTLLTNVSAKEIIYCPPHAILIYKNYNDNIDYVISTCMEKDEYSKEKALDLCMLKALQKMTQEKINEF